MNSSEVWVSPAIATLILVGWAISLGTIWTQPLAAVPLLGKVVVVLWQTFLYTGLFVVAHDAMHGTAFPGNRALNDGLGTVALWLYGLFSFQELRHRHYLHHQFPASSHDPDYDGGYEGQNQGFWRWYWRFMTRYWRWPRFFALVLLFHMLHTLGIAQANLAWGWVYPSLLSSLHLFYFGTYLPHRRRLQGYSDRHCAFTTPRPFLLSLLACYHFSYHHEHHAYPTVPWWQLPQVYRQQQQTAQTTIPSGLTRL